jgi:hypothetical protein
MDSFNTVGLVGFLDLDLTTRWQGDSTQVTSFTLRLEEHAAAKTHLVYVPVIAYGKTAEHAATSPLATSLACRANSYTAALRIALGSTPAGWR